MSRVASLRAALVGVWPARGTFRGEVFQSFLTNVALTGLGVISGVLLARLLGPARRGELAAIQALPMIVAGLGQLGLNEAVIYFGARDRERVGRWAVSAGALGVLAGIPIVLATVAVTPWVLSEYAPRVVRASQLFTVLLLLNAVDGIAVSTVRALHRIAAWNVLRSVPRVLWVVLVLACFAAGVTDPVWIALIYLGLYVLLAPGLVWAVRGLIRPHWRPVVALWPGLLRYGLPVAAGVAPRLLNERLDQLVVAAMLGAHDLGLYAVALAWTGLAQLPAMTITAVTFSKIAGLSGLDEQLAFVRKGVVAVLATAAPAALVLAAATPFAIRRVFGDEFREASPLAFVLLVAVVVRSAAWMIQVGMQAIGRPSVGLVSQWTGLAALWPTAALLIPELGALGAAWSLVVASSVALVAALSLAGPAVRAERVRRAAQAAAPPR